MTRKAIRINGLLCVLALVGCTKSAPEAPTPAAETPAGPPVVVTRFSVEDATPAEARRFTPTPDDLGPSLRARLEAIGLRFADDAPDDAARLTLTARLVHGFTVGEGLIPAADPAPAGARSRAVWAVEARLRAPGSAEGQHIFLEGMDEAPVEGDGALGARIDKAFDPVVQGLKTRVGLLGLGTPALTTRLDDPDPAVRLAAIDQLAFRRDAAAVEAISRRTRIEKEREVLLRLIGALAEIGDDGAARALIDLANPRDRELLRAVLDALSVVGGERVGDFFDILASHDDADVRAMVEDARARLQRKGAP
ncbi:MAG: HEAT repeat domain-containing protein [bacterium]